MFIDHTQRRSTVGRTLLDEWSARRRDLYLTTHDTHNRQISMPRCDSNPRSQQASGLRPLACWDLACNIIFPSTPGLLHRPFPSRFPSWVLQALHILAMHATFPPTSSSYYFITLTVERDKTTQTLNSIIIQLPPAFRSLSSPVCRYSFITFYPCTLILCSLSRIESKMAF